MPAKILVVDDEPDFEWLVCQQFRKKIKTQQYEFVFAVNGAEAIEKLDQHRDIDLVLCDINMPIMDGLTMISKLSEISPWLKAIMVSAYGDMPNIRTAMNRGAYDFVTKPIDFEDLEITMEKALREIESLKSADRTREDLIQIQQELSVAREIQQSILPQSFAIFPQGSPFEIYANMIPANDVGGDFYDFFLLDDHRLGFVIGDVSGKGVPAALFMAISRTLVKATALEADSTSSCLSRVNYLLCQDNPESMFVTMFYGMLDFRSGELQYSNGGHNLPFLMDVEGQARFLRKHDNVALGLIEDFEYDHQTLVFEPGGILVLYTDGISEAMDRNSNEFSDDRLREFLLISAHASPDAIVKGLIEEVHAFAAGVPQSDDITTLVVRHNR
jgi:sigma-B regulation protein RsbU (phosphoserine phosphatase)